MSYVAIEQFICPICGETHSHKGDLILNLEFNDVTPDESLTSYNLCEDDLKLAELGYIAVIEVSNTEDESAISIEQGIRTGNIIHVHMDVLEGIPTFPITEDTVFLYTDSKVFGILRSASTNFEHSNTLLQ